jgi:hypothetical protein
MVQSLDTARAETAETLAQQLYRAENALDLAVQEVSGLLSTLPQARCDAGLSAVAGRSIFRHMGSAVAALLAAREGLSSAHEDLARLSKILKIDTVAIGPLDKPDDEPPVGGGGSGVHPGTSRHNVVNLG